MEGVAFIGSDSSHECVRKRVVCRQFRKCLDAHAVFLLVGRRCLEFVQASGLDRKFLNEPRYIQPHLHVARSISVCIAVHAATVTTLDRFRLPACGGPTRFSTVQIGSCSHYC